MISNKLRKGLDALASLGDPVRRKLYEAAAGDDRELTRNDLAKVTGIARPLAAYHLERLVKEGLLEARFERKNGRTGPGAGRPSKLYFRPKAPFQVTLPSRDYELAARVMAETMARSSDANLRETLHEVALEVSEDAAGAEAESGQASGSEAIKAALIERGYEPVTDEAGVIWLRNCVFHPLSQDQRELVCGMNLSLMQGLLKAVPGTGLTPRLEPREGRCCVVLVPSQNGLDTGPAKSDPT